MARPSQGCSAASGRSPPHMTTPKRRWLLPAVAVAASLALLAAAYLVAANAWLRSGRLQQVLDRHPDHFFIRYGAAWTVLPGVVHLRRIELHGQSRRVQWGAAIDSATIVVDLPRLLRRELVAGSLDASGVAVRVRRRPEATPGAEAPAQTPPIPGLRNTPAPPEAPEPAETPGAPAPWRIRLGGVTLDRLREVWIGDYRFAGDASAAGGFDLRPHRGFALDPATATLRSGTLLVAARPMLGSIAGAVSFELPAVDPDRLQGSFMQLASGRARLQGQLADLGFLQPYLHGVPWLELAGNAGAFAADLRVRRGAYLAGTHAEARPGDVAARLFGDQAAGRGRVSWDVTPAPASGGGSGAVGTLAAVFDEFRLGRAGAAEPLAHGRGLRVEVATRDLRVDGLPVPAALAVDLPPTEVGDFSAYNADLPRGAGIALRAGTGLVSASLRAAAPAWEATGGIELRGRGLVIEIQGARLRGNLHAQSRFRALPRQRQVFLTESSVELAGVEQMDAAAAGAAPPPSAPAPGWWARLRLDYAMVRPGSAVELQARMRSTWSDTRPLFVLFGLRDRPLLSRLDRLLDLHPIGAVGELTMGEGFFAIDSLDMTSGKADVRARLRFAGGHGDGVLYAAYGPLSVGMQLRGGRRSWKLVHAREWFDRAAAR